MRLSTDVLVVGAGGAGMYAAISAAAAGADVLLVDKNLIGRGGATIMAQMTVAAALSEQEPDRWEDHLDDTLTAGRGLCDPELAELVCRLAPQRMREMDDWGVGWARAACSASGGSHIAQVMAPGHSVSRCCYVDFLNTGPAVAKTLRKRISKVSAVRRVSDLVITDLVVDQGRICGALARQANGGEPVFIVSKAVVIATGGLTKLFARSSASHNMSGEGYALALRAGAELIDMEFVQFFPIGHLAPRLVGMDPIMWDPFRYKLGGRLLNGHREEFVHRYGEQDEGKYRVTRDLATYAICQEVGAGRGSPHGGVWLSFAHLPEQQLRAAFGPVIDRLRGNGIDLTTDGVEVSPIAHYHMGGIRVDASLSCAVRGLYAAGEAVGGPSGANRLSGNAISEALVLGDLAGAQAARFASQHRPHWSEPAAAACLAAGPESGEPGDLPSPAALLHRLRALMWENVGPFRHATRLQDALDEIRALRGELLARPLSANTVFAHELFDWFEVRAALDVAEAVTLAALARRESRGAHQREDYISQSDAFAYNQTVRQVDGKLELGRAS